MKLVTFADPRDGSPRLGVLGDHDSCVLDLQAAHIDRLRASNSAFESMQRLIEHGTEALAWVARLAAEDNRGKGVHRVGDVRLLAPLPEPLQFRDALCFRAHLVNALERRKRIRGGDTYLPQEAAMLDRFGTRPFYYKGNRFAVVGHEEDVAWPAYSKVMDYELEMAMVVGKSGRNIPVEQAGAHIFGYTIFNDLSARDVQQPEMEMLGPAKCKDFDGGNIFGPCIVTADAFSPDDVAMTVRINGELQSSGRSGTMQYSFPELIAFVSQDETLRAGEIICSGTVGGGCGDENGRFLASGDVIELEIEGIGTLRNRIWAHGSAR